MKAEHIISCVNVGLVQKNQTVFSDISFKLGAGQGGLIIADPHSRARKLLEVCASVTSPTRGTVKWFDTALGALNKVSLLALRRRIGWVHRESRLVSNMTLLDNISLGLVYYNNLKPQAAHSHVREIMERFRLYDYRNLRPADLSYKKNRLAVYVREIAKKPDLYLFEAPAADLDQDFEPVMTWIKDQVAQQQAAFIISDETANQSQHWVDWVLVLDEKGNQFWIGEQDDRGYPIWSVAENLETLR